MLKETGSQMTDTEYNEFVEKYRPYLLSVAGNFNYLGGLSPEDHVQNILVWLWKNRSKVDGPAPIKFVKQRMVWRYQDAIRKFHNERLNDEEGLGIAEENNETESISNSGTPVDIQARMDSKDVIEYIVNHKDEYFRQVMGLLLLGHSNSEIATLIGRTSSAVDMKAFHCRKEMDKKFPEFAIPKGKRKHRISYS